MPKVIWFPRLLEAGAGERSTSYFLSLGASDILWNKLLWEKRSILWVLDLNAETNFFDMTKHHSDTLLVERSRNTLGSKLKNKTWQTISISSWHGTTESQNIQQESHKVSRNWAHTTVHKGNIAPISTDSRGPSWPHMVLYDSVAKVLYYLRKLDFCGLQGFHLCRRGESFLTFGEIVFCGLKGFHICRRGPKSLHFWRNCILRARRISYMMVLQKVLYFLRKWYFEGLQGFHLWRRRRRWFTFWRNLFCGLEGYHIWLRNWKLFTFCENCISRVQGFRIRRRAVAEGSLFFAKMVLCCLQGFHLWRRDRKCWISECLFFCAGDEQQGATQSMLVRPSALQVTLSLWSSIRNSDTSHTPHGLSHRATRSCREARWLKDETVSVCGFTIPHHSPTHLPSRRNGIG